jgi:hypothetical protein
MAAGTLVFVMSYAYNLFGEYEVFDNNNGSYEFVKSPKSNYAGQGSDRVTIPYGKVELGKDDFADVTPDKIQKRPAAAAGRRRRKTKKSKRRSRKTRRSV